MSFDVKIYNVASMLLAHYTLQIHSFHSANIYNVGGLKAAINNPTIGEEGTKKAQEKLDAMGQ